MRQVHPTAKLALGRDGRELPVCRRVYVGGSRDPEKKETGSQRFDQRMRGRFSQRRQSSDLAAEKRLLVVSTSICPQHRRRRRSHNVRSPVPWWLSVLNGCIVFGIVGALCYGVYRLNQSAVRNVLEPRGAELKAFLLSMKSNANEIPS